jgi:hypothetical protein
MQRAIGRWRALANAVCVLAILAVSAFGMVQVASREWWVQETFHVRVALTTIGGLVGGLAYGATRPKPGAVRSTERAQA